jgi:hypothetical protein
VSSSVQCGRRADPGSGVIRRVSADELEGLLLDHLGPRVRGPAVGTLDQLVDKLVRVEVLGDAVRIVLSRAKLLASALVEAVSDPADPALCVLTLPIRCRRRGGRSWIETPVGAPRQQRNERDPVLIKGLRQSHRIAAELGWRAADKGLTTIEAKVPVSAYERGLCRLAFLAPDIQAAILQGRQPRTLTLQTLLQNPIVTSWVEQRRTLGFETD